MKMAGWLVLTVVLLSVGWVWSAPFVTSPWGQILGKDATGPNGIPYSAYLSIPYAIPPVGERRFAKPLPHPGPGQGRVFNATNLSYVCPQQWPGVPPESMSEDCLTLNVFVPDRATGSNSVMIFIHGGGFVFGSAAGFTPSELVTENNVIVVVIQYRLGVLGFLSSADDVISGNYGLWDQNLAIRWVKDNIRSFGGDNTSMTIFGESAGAASVGFQMLTPYSKGLFSRVLFQSGTPLTTWALNKDPTKAFYYLANQTGCRPTISLFDRFYCTLTGGRQQSEHQSILACLRRVDVSKLLQYIYLPAENPGFSSINAWIPSVDEDFLPGDPADLLRDVEYLAEHDITSRDVMMGVNNDEGAMIVGMQQVLDIKFNGEFLSGVLDEYLQYQYDKLGDNENRMKTLTDVMKFFYTQSVNDGPVPLQELCNAVADGSFTVPAARFMRGLASSAAKGTYQGHLYLYLFNHYPASKADQEEPKGTYHAEDLAYEFDGIPGDAFLTRDNFTADQYTLASTFRSIVSNFAKTGRPQLTLQTESDGLWPEFTVAEEKYLSLDTVPRVEDHLYNKRMALWLELVPSLVNSTRIETKTLSWHHPWHQSGWNSNDNTRYKPSHTQNLFSWYKSFFSKRYDNFFKFF